jgi:hypothetical protein
MLAELAETGGLVELGERATAAEELTRKAPHPG